jgi:hypothetical protein
MRLNTRLIKLEREADKKGSDLSALSDEELTVRILQLANQIGLKNLETNIRAQVESLVRMQS